MARSLDNPAILVAVASAILAICVLVPALNRHRVFHTKAQARELSWFSAEGLAEGLAGATKLPAGPTLKGFDHPQFMYLGGTKDSGDVIETRKCDTLEEAGSQAKAIQGCVAFRRDQDSGYTDFMKNASGESLGEPTENGFNKRDWFEVQTGWRVTLLHLFFVLCLACLVSNLIRREDTL